MQIIMGTTVNDDQFLFTCEFFKEPPGMRCRDQGIIGVMKENDRRLLRALYFSGKEDLP